MNLNQRIESWLTSRKGSFKSDNRPFVTLAYAQSWDGSITTRCGETLPLSGAEATRLTHQLRSLHDGILVGIGTVLSDDPRLTVREWSGPNPQPIVLDSQLRMPRAARLCRHPDKQCWILTLHDVPGDWDKQAEIMTLADGGGECVPLTAALSLLRDKGIKALMVEGGATVITAFLKDRLADVLILTVAPRLLGGYRAIGDLGTTDLGQLPEIQSLQSAMLGQDLIVWGILRYGDRQA
jgi:riboflavin-specific deaminase-like protein